MDLRKIIDEAKTRELETLKWIEELFQKYDSVEILSQCILPVSFKIEGQLDNKYSEFPFLQFVTGIALKYSNTTDEYKNEEVGVLLERGVEYFRNLYWSFHDPEETDMAKGEVVSTAKMQGVITQLNPNMYPYQTEHYKENCLRKISPIVEELFGFSVEDYFRFDERIRQMYERRLDERRDFSILLREEEEGKYHSDIEFKKKVDAACSEANISIDEFFQRREIIFHFFDLKEIFIFKAEDISRDNEELDRAKRFLTSLSCKFGSNNNYTSVFSDNIILEKPIVDLEDGSYFVPIMTQLFNFSPSIFESLLVDEKLKQTKNWQRYLKIKSNFVVDSAASFLERIFPRSAILKEIVYFENSEKFETDILVDYCGKLFVFEVKSGFLTKPAKRGAYERVKTDLKKIADSAFDQGKRFVEHLGCRGKLDLFDGNRNFLRELKFSDFDEILLNTISLEPLLKLGTNPRQLKDVGLFDGDKFPWIVNLYELDLVTDYLTRPSMFYHYTECRRNEMPKNLFHSFDELSFLSHYMNLGNFYTPLTDDGEAPSFVMIDTANIYEFDAHYILGEKRPELNINKRFHEIVYNLDVLKSEGYLNIARELLDFDKAIQAQFLAMLEGLENRIKDGKTFIDGSIHYNSTNGDRGGISVMMGYSRKELEYKLPSFCYIKKYQQKALKWIGLGIDLTDNFSEVNFYCFLLDPWKYSEEDERLLKLAFPSS